MTIRNDAPAAPRSESSPTPESPIGGGAAGEAEPKPHYSVADRSSRIAEAAYRRAHTRNFAPGGELEDWLCAEREIDGL